MAMEARIAAKGTGRCSVEASRASGSQYSAICCFEVACIGNFRFPAPCGEWFKSEDSMLLFSQESMYWLTGYDTFGFCFFQCLVLGSHRTVLLTRSADRLQARITSNIEDIKVWIDGDDAAPARDLASLVQDMGLSGKRLAVETDTHGLTARNYIALTEAFDGIAEIVDSSDIISKLRLVKSEEELGYVRKAAVLADDALDAAAALIAPGAYEGEILAAMHGAIFSGGGDYPGNEFIIGSGENALLCRYSSGRRKPSSEDQLTLEFAGVYRHYHAALMRTAVIGSPRNMHVAMHSAATDALLRCEECIAPGSQMQDVFKAHAETLDGAGFRSSRLNACGYSLGARFTPTWMEREMFRPDSRTMMEPGMVFFVHIILVDAESGTAMSTGRTSIVTHQGSEQLSRHDLEMIVH